MNGNSSDCGCKCLVVACRFFGIITALFLWGCGVEYLYHGTIFGAYFLTIAIIATLLEAVFVLNYVVETFVTHDSILIKVWDCVLWMDDWKKGGLYFVLFAPACFVHPAEVELAVPAGILLISTGILYMLKTFNTKKEEEEASIEENTTYDRFDEEVEDPEGDMVNQPNGPGGGMPSLADQSEILDL